MFCCLNGLGQEWLGGYLVLCYVVCEGRDLMVKCTLRFGGRARMFDL